MSNSTIHFNEIPSPRQVPGSSVEVVAGYQNVGIFPIPARTLIIGGKTSGATAPSNTVIPNVTRALDADGFSGQTSQISSMVRRYLTPNQQIPLDVICVPDAGGAVKATWTITFAGTATAGGTPALGITGDRIFIGSQAGDTAATAATEFAAAISMANPCLPFSSIVAVGAVVTVIASNGGTCGNDISFVPNPARGDMMPPGLTMTVAQTVQGATNPSIATALAAVATTWYTDIVIAWQDSANLALLNTELERRWNAMTRKDARGHVGITGTFSQQLAAVLATNARFIFASPMTKPGSPPWALAAAAAGACAQHLTEDPSRQLDEIALPGIVGSQPADMPDDNEKELLLEGGCSVFRTLHDGTVTMERYVSTYTLSPQGNMDPAWHDVMEQAVASRIRYDWRAYFRALYPRNKLADDGSLAAAYDTSVVTPNRAKASWGARHMVYARNGWVIDEVAQANAAVFVRDPNDPNRLNYKIPLTRIGNLIVDAGQLIFNVGGE